MALWLIWPVGLLFVWWIISWISSCLSWKRNVGKPVQETLSRSSKWSQTAKAMLSKAWMQFETRWLTTLFGESLPSIGIYSKTNPYTLIPGSLRIGFLSKFTIKIHDNRITILEPGRKFSFFRVIASRGVIDLSIRNTINDDIGWITCTL